MAALASCWPLVTACDAGGATSSDAAPDAQPGSDVTLADTAPALLAVDFTISRCPELDVASGQCKSRAPATVSFIPVGSSGLTKFLWDFGDKTATSPERTPQHTYLAPGSYTVTVVAANSTGSVAKTHAAIVWVTANQVGDPCDSNGQCETGLACLCGDATKCPTSFARGVCTTTCDAKACDGDETCTDLTGGKPADKQQPWEKRLCLPACANSLECSPDLRCRSLPAFNPAQPGLAGSWTKACFVETPADLAASCRGPDGTPHDGDCLTGLCADLGANGLCSQDCTTATCPPGSVCAAMNNGKNLCLRACSAGFTCGADPLLGCAAPGATGPLGFRVPLGAEGAMYCSAKRCRDASDCGPSGVCKTEQAGSHCVRK